MSAQCRQWKGKHAASGEGELLIHPLLAKCPLRFYEYMWARCQGDVCPLRVHSQPRRGPAVLSDTETRKAQVLELAGSHSCLRFATLN